MQQSPAKSRPTFLRDKPPGTVWRTPLWRRLVVVVLMLAFAGAAMPQLKAWLKRKETGPRASTAKEDNALLWDMQHPELLRLPRSVIQTLGVATAEIRKGARSRRLEL